MSVSVQTGRKIGLMSSIAIMIGAVIGIGIFFKNGSVFRFNNFNDVGVLLSWIIALIIALTTALSFSVFGFSKKPGAGLSGAIGQFKKEKLARFVALMQAIFYYAILVPAIAFFSAEALLIVTLPQGAEKPEIWHIFLLAAGLFFVVLIINIVSIRLSSSIQMLATFMKFIPLIAIAIIGIVFGVQNQNVSLFHSSPKSGSFTFNGLLASLPSILFAFDSFLGIGQIQHKLKNPKRNVPITLVAGIIIVGVIYIFITVGQAFVSEGFAYGVVSTAFATNENVRTGLTIAINVSILISILGVLNSMVLVWIRTCQYTINEHIFFMWPLFSKIKSKKFDDVQGSVLTILLFVIWFAIYAAINIALNTDAYVDLLSNFPTLFFFVLYGTAIAVAFDNKIKQNKYEAQQSIPALQKNNRHSNWELNTEVQKNTISSNSFVKMTVGKWIYPIWVIAIIGCFFVFAYQFVYGYTIQTWQDPYNTKLFSFGLFYDNGVSVVPWIVSLLFFLMIVIFFVTPFINDLILKIIYKKQQNDNNQQYLLKLLV